MAFALAVSTSVTVLRVAGAAVTAATVGTTAVVITTAIPTSGRTATAAVSTLATVARWTLGVVGVSGARRGRGDRKVGQWRDRQRAAQQSLDVAQQWRLIGRNQRYC